MPAHLSRQSTLYTPSVPGLLGPGLRVELEALGALTPAQVDTVLAYAAEDGRLVSIALRPSLAGGWLLFQTLELATGLTYDHKLEPDGRAWHVGRAVPGNPWTHPPPETTW